MYQFNLYYSDERALLQSLRHQRDVTTNLSFGTRPVPNLLDIKKILKLDIKRYYY
jgi:hypothetical protein